ncbi:ATPase family associated with various cellular activities (AAA) [Methylobacterium sp. UNC300MFChir4.1]|uniref:AAA family ATPase n=1 Tax=Methylobacterium TaxID=407 RepID=UPI0008B4DCC9|nr:AAA family ATPase [Methylobacterium sp. UNC300MFChir4.1]SEP07482.1 ATPase family associated with various cellular activities (AAA) [Methylobacterium sp. UNC300MFChir4.1]
MAFSSTPPALQIDSEAARRLLEPMLPRRLRACLTQDLRVASACSELALEITTLAPDAEALVSAWIGAATSEGGLWRDRRWIARRSALIRFLDVWAVEHDQPVARALADVATLLSCAGDDRRAAARLAQPLWLEREAVLDLRKGLAALAEAQTRLTIGRVTGQGAESDVTGATDLAVALQAAWHDALTDALLTFSEKTSSAIAAAATLACGADDDAFDGDVALVHALVPVGEILTRPVADSAATRERRRWKRIEAQLVQNETRRREKAAAVETTPQLPDADAPPAEVPKGHVLVVPAIQETGSDRGRSIARGYEHVIGKALPLVAVPDLAVVRTRLVFEFPYAQVTIDRLLTDLIGREYTTFRPTLLIGPPGAGKTRLIARIAFHLGLGLWRVDATRDAGASLGGLDRRWATSEPAHPIMAVARTGSANPLMQIDELEKSATRSDHGRLWDALLSMLEPETARTYQDPCFQTETDISRVSWLATGNEIGNLPAPLLDRLRVLEMPAPSHADLDALLEPVLVGIAADHGLAPAFIAPLDGEEIALLRRSWRGGSVRRLIRLVEAVVNARETLAVRQ